jgi:glucokinase
VRTIGIDIGGTEIKAGIVDDTGAILRASRRDSEPRDPEELIRRVVELVDELSGDAPVGALGIGVPGLIAAGTGTLLRAPNMPGIDGTNLGDRIGGETGLPTLIRNDADLNAWGEFRAGAGIGTRHMICLTVGTGLGSGMIIGGQLHAGATGYGAEAGHIVVEPGGRSCGCGGQGCLETIVSATGIVARASDRIRSGEPTILVEAGLTAQKVHDAAAGGDAVALAVYSEVGRFLGIGCATLMNLVNPELIAIGGGVSAAGDLLLGPAIKEARHRAYPEVFAACRIEQARLGVEAGVVGAGLLAAEMVPERRTD